MSVERDAVEYGAHIKHGGWRLGLLVARNVQPGKGNGRPPRETSSTDEVSKVSAIEFARRAGTSDARVTRHYKAWQAAAAAGLVPDADTLAPGDDVALPEDEATPWADFYDASDAGSRPRDSKATDAAKIIERRGAQAVVAEMTTEQRQEVVEAAILADPDVARTADRALTEAGDRRRMDEEQRAPSHKHPEVQRSRELAAQQALYSDLGRHLRAAQHGLTQARDTLDGTTIELSRAQGGDLCSHLANIEHAASVLRQEIEASLGLDDALAELLGDES